ncbi:MAG: DUF427 domain-containing protein [Pseudomonadota bacterium]
MWEFKGQKRPAFADEPAEGQESVWDYPRPPAIVAADHTVRVESGSLLVARSDNAKRVLETASPPSYYLPPDDVAEGVLVAVPGQSFCEWKGSASYWALAEDPSAAPVAFSYETPTRAFESIRGYLGFYPGRLECFVGDERVRPQPGGFYAGWITDSIAGPVKGEPGTGHW